MADMEVDVSASAASAWAERSRKENLGTIVSWVCEELGEDRPRHLLGLRTEDLFSEVLQPVPTPLTASTPREWHENAA